MGKTVLILSIFLLPLYARLGVPDKEPGGNSEKEFVKKPQKVEQERKSIIIEVTGEGAAPPNCMSPAQARILAKRAALADAYRKLSERVAGVMVKGQDKIENMIVTESVVQTNVQAVVKNAKVIDTKCDYDVCEVTLQLRLRRHDKSE